MDQPGPDSVDGLLQCHANQAATIDGDSLDVGLRSLKEGLDGLGAGCTEAVPRKRTNQLEVSAQGILGIVATALDLR